MTKAIKVEFLRNISFFLYRSWVFNTEEDFQEKFKIFYRKFCVYEQDKDFIDEKLVLKKEKSVSYFFRYVRSQYIMCTLFLFHRYILFFDKTHFYFINFYFRGTNLFAALLPHYKDRVLHRKEHITFLSAG